MDTETLEKPAVGRPTSYRTNFCKPARALIKFGATESDVAEYFDVNISTLIAWQNEHPEFHKAVKGTKEIADAEVVKSLYKRALGYTIKLNQQKVTKDGEVLDCIVEQHVPASEVACIFWLKNRRPKEWRDKIEANITAEGSPLGTLAIEVARVLASGVAQAKEVKQIVDVVEVEGTAQVDTSSTSEAESVLKPQEEKNAQ